MSVAVVRTDVVDLGDLIARSEFRSLPNAVETAEFLVRQSTRVYIGKQDDTVACAFGLMPPTVLSQEAYIWLIHTDEIEKHKFLFLRHSQLMIEKMLNEYPVIVGYCKEGDRKAVRWMKWLGAEFRERNGNMLPFVIRKK